MKRRRSLAASRAAAPALALLAAAGLWAGPAGAEPIEHMGLVFSDHLGGFELLEVSGRGSVDDPIVVVERITGSGEAVLAISGLDRSFGNPARSNHFVGFALVKIAINGTDQDWRAYHIELQEELGVASVYGDGLSFGQDQNAEREILAFGLPQVRVVDEPGDALGFSGGTVAPGQAAEFHLLVTDNSPNETFYLVQRQETPVSSLSGGLARVLD
jgi:hypothetical protein